jgi:hypothetical protein
MDTYFANLENGKYSESYSMLSEARQSDEPRSSWIASARDFRAQAGDRLGGGVTDVTVYIDPPGAPLPGVYVAADYEIKYERVPFRCGYIVWFQNENGLFEAISEETGSIDEETAFQLSAEQLLEVRRRFRCIAP